MATQYSAQMPQATQAATWALAGVSHREGARVANLSIPVATRHPFRAVTDRERPFCGARASAAKDVPRAFREHYVLRHDLTVYPVLRESFSAVKNVSGRTIGRVNDGTTERLLQTFSVHGIEPVAELDVVARE